MWQNKKASVVEGNTHSAQVRTPEISKDCGFKSLRGHIILQNQQCHL